MTYLLAIFLPPLYFFKQKRGGAAFLTGFLFCLSLVFYLMVVLAPVGLILWGVSAVSAVWDLRKRLMREQAKMIAEEMTGSIREPRR